VNAPQVAVLGPGGQRAAPRRVRADAYTELPLVRLVTFAALALYGTLRWSTLLSGAGQGRLLGLLALAILLAGARPPLARRSRSVAAIATALALIAAFPLAGVPLAWVLHVRIAVTGTAIGNGLSALPSALLPYAGVNEWLRLVIVLGAAVLLFDGALLLAFAPRAMEDLRRAGAALPMVALAAVPATLVHPRFPYLDGLVLFALLAAFIWGERIERRQVAAAVSICAVAAVPAMVVGPALDRHKPWINYEALAGTFAPRVVDTFDWSQGYGPIKWPRAGRTVLQIQAAHSDYWKAENLDLFDGRGWVSGSPLGAGNPMDTVSGAASKRWTQTLDVTIGSMSTSEVIASGLAYAPTRLPGAVVAGPTPGTWMTPYLLGPGDSYQVAVYAPHPTSAELVAAGTDYPSALVPGYLSIMVPESPSGAPAAAGGSSLAPSQQVIFSPFGSQRSSAYGPSSVSPTAVIEASPYARAYALARRLAAKSPTPYAFVLAVEQLLSRGYTYSENPPRSAYPLESFLFATKLGYCQQFAGAMALLLRMGGVPARVAVGFTPGRYDSPTKRWLVSDVDAHAWVEAWFPGYGWVRFDPTPPADPALGGRTPISSVANAGGATPAAPPLRRGDTASAAAAGNSTHRAGSARAGHSVGPLEAALALGAVALLGALVLVTRPLASGEELVAELERALARSGRPLAAGATLASLEYRMVGSTAAAYVRALRLQRFGGATDPPTPGQRRALRAHLRAGLGPLGRLRALWALPPRRSSSPTRPQRPEGA